MKVCFPMVDKGNFDFLFHCSRWIVTIRCILYFIGGTLSNLSPMSAIGTTLSFCLSSSLCYRQGDGYILQYHVVIHCKVYHQQ